MCTNVSKIGIYMDARYVHNNIFDRYKSNVFCMYVYIVRNIRYRQLRCHFKWFRPLTVSQVTFIGILLRSFYDFYVENIRVYSSDVWHCSWHSFESFMHNDSCAISLVKCGEGHSIFVNNVFQVVYFMVGR